MSSASDPQLVGTALEEIRGVALQCVACKLAQDRTNVVFGVGNPSTPMVLVGQSPGEQEDLSGEPFVGRAGQLLTDCLSDCGIKRKHIYISNIVKCRPWVSTAAGRGRNRDPEDDEIRACRPWIEAELALIRPRVIVCLGAPSATLILGRAVAITKDRGKWFTEHPFRPAHVMPVLHPAYILRQAGRPSYDELKDQLTRDLDSARRMAARLLKEPRAAAEADSETAQRSLFDEPS
ncbi:MAG: uracil-DNA glycosylase [Armatimonadetes bacterium]|nr:uracil-DNA glycosylase [Armatimonadota bacterium]